MTFVTALSLTMILSSNHPITLILSLILITTIMAYKTYILTKLSLMSYAIILVLLGGLIVLFIYMTSLAPNEPFTTNKNYASLLVWMAMLMYLNYMPMTNHPSEYYTFKISSIMLYPFWVALIMSYLFMTLVAVVKITSMNNGPLRSVY